MTVIEVKDLKKNYNSLEAVRGVSFEVTKGEIFGILGPNGAGKTTTLEILEGLKTPSFGTATVLGLELPRYAFEIKKRIGVQLQASEYLHHLNLKELLELFASLYKTKIDTKQILGFVGLEGKMYAPVKNLSGGQKQRFTLASALVNNPEVLFLDEPTTGLDPRARRDVWELVRNINQKGITIVLTTHYMEEAEYLCKRVAIMDQGQILTISEPRKLIEQISTTTQVSFLTDANLEQSFWQDLPEIEKVYSVSPKVILEVNTLEIIPNILARLRERQIEFSGFTVKTATLEDVYLDLTGKEFLQA